MKISVIVWDGNFRENLHTIEFFANQSLSKDDYEFIWVDYYNSNDRVRKIISGHPNFKLVTLNNPTDDKWHLGMCMNKGVEEASGDIILLPDGDIVVEDDFLSYIRKEHEKHMDLVLYHRRLDEPASAHSTRSNSDIGYLKSVVKLTTPTNFAGCFSLLKSNFNKVLGYEEHNAFCGPGMNAMEINSRFRNAGLCIKWSTDKMIYHPWHPSSTNAGEFFENRKFLQFVRGFYNWLNPYAGIEQSWIFRCRELNLDIRADAEQCKGYLSTMPPINLENLRSIFSNINK
jgi:hypothetical protein